MKIAVPVDEQINNGTVCISFGRTLYFLVFDDEKGSYFYVENTAAQATGGAGIKAAQILVDNGVQVLLTPRCGENAVEVLHAAQIPLYKTIDNSIQNNLNAFAAGKLELLQEVQQGAHHGK